MQIKKFFLIILISTALLFLVSCTPNGNLEPGNADPATNAPTAAQPTGQSVSQAGAETQVVLYPAGLDIAVGKSMTLTAEINGNGTAQWTSSNPSAVSVSSDGRVGALAVGESIITVSAAGSRDECRVTVTADGKTLAYQEDPGCVNQDGEREAAGSQEDNYPLFIPDDQDTIDKDCFKDGEYSWQFDIDDQFDTPLKVPNTNISYMTNYHVVLDAHKVGGSAVTGNYEGTLKMEMAIDKASFMSAMKAEGIPITDFNSNIEVKTIDVKFSVVPYQIDEINEAKYAFTPNGTISIPSLIQAQAMAISSTQTSTSGNMNIQAEDGGYGSAVLSDESGNIPYVIEVRPDGAAALYLPRMLSMCDRNWFKGALLKIRLVNLP